MTTRPKPQPRAVHRHAGLTRQEARRRLRRYGPNAATFDKRRSLFFQFVILFRSPLILLLLASAFVSAFFGDLRSAFVIVLMVLASAVLDFVNTYRASKAAEKLRDSIKVTATVIRDRKEQEVPIADIVPGDCVLLRVGDIVPADGTVAEIRHFYVNESPLTGESFPVSKKEGETAWMGSSVTTGEAILTVEKTGSSTRFNSIVAGLTAADTPTEFDREIKAFSMLVLKATIALVIFVFVVNALLKGNWLESFMFAVALAVGMTPEMMPMIITINLSRGSLAMARRGVIVKRLSSIQNFGSMDLLCTDKTGTLTENRIALIQYVDAFGKESQDVLHYAAVSSALEEGFKNPLDEAIKEYKKINVSALRKIDEMPFDFERRRGSVVMEENGKRLLVCKGSPETIFDVCTEIHRNGTHPVHDALKAAHATYQALSKEGFRVLALAMREVGQKQRYDIDDEGKLHFLGLLAFLEPPKKSVAQALKDMRTYGIDIKIITGDNELVTRHVAGEIGLPVTGILLGNDINKLSDAELNERAHGVNLFARVNPEQKLRIIKTLRAHGHVVGYIGDGVNDAPSLKEADVGISVNNATDIAKESADLIMMRKELDDLIQAVIEGRSTFVNTTKYLMMALSSNFGNMFSMAGASLFLPFLPMLPSQVLFNNFLYDASQATLPADNVDDADLRHPKKLRLDVVRKFMMMIGPVSSVFDFLTFALLGVVLHLSVSQFQAGWFMESLATQVFVVYVIRTKLLPFVQSRPGRWLVLGTIAMVAIGWTTALSPLGPIFGFSPLPRPAIIAIGAMVVVYLVLVQLVKQWFYAHAVKKHERESM
jgi:Mg2+-importing ATPase